MRLSDAATAKLSELEESLKNIKILQKEYYSNPVNSNRKDLENAYAVLATDVEFFLQKIDESRP